jgi:hypothetical protein
VATIAVLFGALTPMVAQLARADQSSGLTLVCMAGGLAWVDPATGEVHDPANDPQSAGERCPFCLKQSPALTSVARAAPPYLVLLRTEPVPPVEDAPRPLVVWAHAFSRPPPALA